MKYSIHNPKLLCLLDRDGEQSMGTNQKWFPTLWQRMAGCGPTVATNLLLYHGRAGRLVLKQIIEDQSSVVELMEYSWRHITPGMRGVNKVSTFFLGLEAMLQEHESKLSYHSLEVPESIDDRPSLETVTAFLEEAFQDDSPVAFLNLHSGEVKDLDDWHWMTSFALEHDETNDSWLLSLTDNGVAQTFDLGLWLETSKRGGGFVYLNAETDELRN